MGGVGFLIGELETWLAGREARRQAQILLCTLYSERYLGLMSMEARISYAGQDVEKDLTMKILDLGD